MLLSATFNLENLNSTSESRNPRVLARLSAMPSVPLLLGGRLLLRVCSCLVEIRLSVLEDLVYNIVLASWIFLAIFLISQAHPRIEIREQHSSDMSIVYHPRLFRFLLSMTLPPIFYPSHHRHPRPQEQKQSRPSPHPSHSNVLYPSSASSLDLPDHPSQPARILVGPSLRYHPALDLLEDPPLRACGAWGDDGGSRSIVRL